ncbi:MAG: hypothetical protein PSV35_03530, partial [bacterium]|nr:hypothetical protein [bacterium]
ISKWISSNHLELNTLYLSNIAEWIIQQDSTLWKATQIQLHRLITPQVYLIDAFYPTRKKEGSGPPLRVSKGALPSYELRKLDRNSQSTVGQYFSGLDKEGSPKKSSTRVLFFQSTESTYSDEPEHKSANSDSKNPLL